MIITKRNGKEVRYDGNRIVTAINKAAMETEKGVDDRLSKQIEKDIRDEIEHSLLPVSVENIQDMVEDKLLISDRKDIAKRYILYRSERAKVRDKGKRKYEFLSDEFLSNYKHKEDPFPTELGKFVYYRTYSRPIPEESRRERWWETTARVVNYNTDLEKIAMQRQGIQITDSVIARLTKMAEEIYDMMYNLKLFPSGRSLWLGGTKASYLYPLGNFNCSFVTIDQLKKFSEIFFVLMLGTGVGLSVERKYVNKLPKINSNIEIIHKDFKAVPKSQRKEHTELKIKTPTALEIVVGDSKFSWSRAIEMYFDIISSKQYADIELVLINYDNVRPAGERIKTFGGFASGYQAIKQMFEKIDEIFKNKKQHNRLQWQTIKPIDCLDISTIIAENVVAGGTRRSAEIVFCDKDERDVLEAKANLFYQNDGGEWISNDKLLHRMLSNNTVFYNEKPTKEELVKQFELIKVAGEPSFGNMAAMKKRREDVQGGNPLT